MLDALNPSAASGYAYERRRPEQGTLYQVVRDNLQTLYAAVEDGFAAPLPVFVRDEFERYLACGILCRGFAWLQCDTCHEQRLVAFSCKGRGFCPSCMGRRMAQSAANLVDHVLPLAPLRRRRGVVEGPQFVITFPFELRARLAYDGKLLGAATRIAIDSVLGFYKRRMRDVDRVIGQSGAVSVVLRPLLGVVVQRTNSDLRLNPHLHAILLDGVFVADNGSPVFHPLLHLDDSDLADLLQVIRVRVLGFLERRGIMVLQPLLGVVESRHELTLLDDDFAEREPEWNLQRSGRFRVTGMTNEQEVKIQTRGPDRGNPTSKRQGLCRGAPRLSRREANVARPARGGLKEVIDAWRSRTQVKCRKAHPADKLADGSEVQYLLVPACVLATGSTRGSLVLPSEICRVSAKAVARRTKDERS